MARKPHKAVPLCRVCRADAEMRDPGRFNYPACDVHAKVPPAYLDDARAQFLRGGKTKWDAG